MCNEHAFRRHGKHDTGILSDGLHIVILCTEGTNVSGHNLVPKYYYAYMHIIY